MESATTWSPSQPYGIANVDKQARVRQMPYKGRKLPIAPAQICWPWHPQRPQVSTSLLEIAKPLFPKGRWHVETLIWTDPGLGQYYLRNGTLGQILPRSREESCQQGPTECSVKGKTKMCWMDSVCFCTAENCWAQSSTVSPNSLAWETAASRKRTVDIAHLSQAEP